MSRSPAQGARRNRPRGLSGPLTVRSRPDYANRGRSRRTMGRGGAGRGQRAERARAESEATAALLDPSAVLRLPPSAPCPPGFATLLRGDSTRATGGGMERGIVVAFDPGRGFGFIRSRGSAGDVFVHASAI